MRFGYAILLSVLASCNGPVASEQSQAVDPRNYAEEVRALPEKQREAVLLRAIRDAGISCQEVTAAESVGAEDERPGWRARCADGSYHLVTIDAAGTALVASRRGP